MPETLTITSNSDRGRSFTVSLLALVTADRSWDAGRSATGLVPVYLSYAESHDCVKAFTANLRSGAGAQIRDAHGRLMTRWLEVPSSARMKWPPVQRLKKPRGVSIASAYSPELCSIEPPDFSPDRVRFAFAPPAWWVDAQAQHDAFSDRPVAERREAALATLFAGFVDRRSPMPPIRDPEFNLRMWRGAQRMDWFGTPEEGRLAPGQLCWSLPLKPPGLEMVAVVDVSHEEFEAFYREILSAYSREVRPSWLEEARRAPDISVVAEPEVVAVPPPALTEPLPSVFDW